MSNILEIIISPQFIATVLRVSTPLLLAALGALVAGQGGIMCIAFEGIMLSASLGAVIGSALFGSVIMGVVFGIAFGLFIVLLYAYFFLRLDANSVLTGLALNILASGGTIFLLFLLTGDKSNSTALASLTLPNINIPFIKDIPVLGVILSGHNVMTYVALISTAFVYVLINKTTLGLRIRSVGENPQAAESLGINVDRIKLTALLIGGVLASLGGIYMSMGYLPFFTKDMVSGRGFMAIAAQNLGGGQVIGTFLAVLFFSATESLSNIFASLNLPAELLQSIPYVATIFGLFIVGKWPKKKKRRTKLSKKNNDKAEMEII